MYKKNIWIDAASVSEILGISLSAVYALLHRGELPYYRFGRSIQIASQDLVEYIHHHRHRGKFYGA